MKAFSTLTSRTVVLRERNIDTDQIIPKQFLKRVERTGFGEFLFYDWAKEPGWDLPRNPILAAGRNFGAEAAHAAGEEDHDHDHAHEKPRQPTMVSPSSTACFRSR